MHKNTDYMLVYALNIIMKFNCIKELEVPDSMLCALLKLHVTTWCL